MTFLRVSYGWPTWGFGLVMLALAGCITVPPPIESHFNKGVAFYDEGRYADAIREYKLELRQHPDNTFAMYNLAVTYQDKGRIEEAAALYRQVLDREEDTRSRVNLAVILHSQGNEEEAYRQLRTAAEKDRDDPNPLSVLGDLEEQSGRLTQARAHYQEALKRDERHALTLFRLGRVAFKLGQFKEGEAALLKAIEIDSEEPVFTETLAEAYLKHGDLPDAIDMLERTSVLQPDREDLYVKLGDLYFQAEYYKEAVERYWEALAIEPNNPYVHRRLNTLFQILAQQEARWLGSAQTSPMPDSAPPTPNTPPTLQEPAPHPPVRLPPASSSGETL